MSNGFLLHSLSFSPLAGIGSAPAAGTAHANVGNDYMGMVLRGAAGQASDVVLDLGSAQPVDTIVIVNARARDGATAVAVQGNGANNWGAPAYSASIDMPATELRTAAGFRHPMLLLSAPVSYRYWRISLQLLAGANLEMARVLIGRRMQYERNFDYGLARGSRDLGEVEHGVHGALLRRRGRILRTLGIAWLAVTKEEAEAKALPFFEQVGNTEMVFACVDPAAHAERSRRCYFGTLEGNAAMTWRAHDMWEKRLQIVSAI